jgi:hypothetical protein
MPDLKGIVFWLIISLTLPLAIRLWAAPATTVWNTGDPANRVDLAIIGDGYSPQDISQYATHVSQLLSAMVKQQPFTEYQRYFNVHRVDLVSPESGADHPELTPPVFKNTALGATYNCAGISQLICIDVSAALDVASQSLAPAQRDLIIVLVNDTTYGGSGGAVAVASRHSAVVELVLHELGHSFGLLADEYGSPPPPYCDTSVEPPEPNVIRQQWNKWSVWISPATQIPTPPVTPGLPGLYEGAKYCDHHLYRPTPNSKMRMLGMPYESINLEQMVKRIYTLVDPIDQAIPAAPAMVLPWGTYLTFGVAVPAPMTHALNVMWWINGYPYTTLSVWGVSTTGVTPGRYVVEVVVSDPTPWVRQDPNQLLQARRSWTVDIVH